MVPETIALRSMNWRFPSWTDRPAIGETAWPRPRAMRKCGCSSSGNTVPIEHLINLVPTPWRGRSCSFSASAGGAAVTESGANSAKQRDRRLRRRTRVAGELTAIHQYIVHNFEHGELATLHDAVLKRAKMEMSICGCCFRGRFPLGGSPVVTYLNAICIGPMLQLSVDRLRPWRRSATTTPACSCHCSISPLVQLVVTGHFEGRERTFEMAGTPSWRWLCYAAAGYLATQGS